MVFSESGKMILAESVSKFTVRKLEDAFYR